MWVNGTAANDINGRIFNDAHQTNNSQPCHVIKPGNSTTFLANWEGIPETLIINAAIGLILFVIFIILTWIAWKSADSSDQLRTQNLVTFLYGYRDPEQWYVIPRFEFLRPEDRHHKHDLYYPYIYVPPKLPMANPLELFAINNQEREKSKSTDSEVVAASRQPVWRADVEAGASDGRATGGSNLGHKTRGHSKTESLTAKTSASAESVLSDPLTLSQSSPNFSNFSSPDRQQQAASGENGTQASTMALENTSKFYPSILTAEQLQASYLSRKLNKFFAYFFKVSDADLIYAKGIDAYEYLLFQRHLILIMFVASILCIFVLLPIHWFAGDSVDPQLVQATSFQRSTIKNIASRPYLHFAHIVCSSLIVLVTLRVMSSYRDSIITQDDAQLSRRTLLIGNIPVEQRTRVKLTKIIREFFPRNTIEAIQFVYNSRPLVDDEMYLSSIIAAKEYCAAYKRRCNREISVHKTDVNQSRACDGYCRCCSFFYICCCYWPMESKAPGTAYYAAEEEKFRKKILDECETMFKEPSEYAFVTFKSYTQARRVMSELANLKQDAIAGRQRGQRSISGKTRSISQDIAGQRSRSKKRREEAPPTQQQQSGGKVKSLAGNSSPFIETTSPFIGGPAVKDPLDPINNPHVRSIRSPIAATGARSDSGQPLAGGARKSPTLTQRDATLVASAKQPVKRDEQALTRNFAAYRQSPAANGGKLEKTPLEGPVMWSVRYAPHPDNVEFADLLFLARTSKWTIMLLHLLMILIFVFITTPNVILSVLERASVLRPDKSVELTGFHKLTINYLTILLQVITTAVLPALITLISKQIPYEDTSSKSHSVMWKVYLFLVLMVIIMPSIGMSSAQALFANDIDPRCLFPVDNGAYYINYVVSSIFLSTILELIKPVDIIFYYFILWTSRSSAEIESGRQFIDREFSVGMQHTAVLLIFSVVMTYAISCPLIAPVGLIYLCVKHAVDHYNLYYSYFTKKVDKDLQSTVVIFVKVALLLMLFQTTIAVFINTGVSYYTLLAQMILWITLAILGVNCFFDCTARTVANTKRSRYHHEFCACFYLPKVIASLLRLDAIPSKFLSRKV